MTIGVRMTHANGNCIILIHNRHNTHTEQLSESIDGVQVSRALNMICGDERPNVGRQFQDTLDMDIFTNEHQKYHPA